MPYSAEEHIRRIVDDNRRLHAAGQATRSEGRIQSVGIIGAGRMGTAIALAHVRHRTPVVIHDVSDAAIRQSQAIVAAELRGADSSTSLSLLRWTNDLVEVAQCDLVLESIVETLAAKQSLFARLSECASNRAILASNTSTIPIGQLASGVSGPSRFCGIHFCHPVERRPLVEIIRAPATSDETIEAAVSHAFAIGKTPIVVQDGPGFVVNRLLFPYLGEALELLREGASIEAIDAAATRFGMEFGPLRLIDEIGLETTLQAAWVLSAAFPERIVSSPLLVSMIKAGRLGQKTGAGFYRYRAPMTDEVIGCPDAEIESILARWAHPNPSASEVSPDRLVLPMLLEATRILEEGKVSQPRDIDLALLFGLGFPANKGGLMFWADTQGIASIRTRLRSLAELGERARPTPMIDALAEHGGTFYC